MSDDIVTRLRNKQQESSKYPKLLLSELAALNEAADEIERLGELLFQEIYSNQLKIDELEYLKTENNRWRIIATELYAAVEQMKKRRGVDMDDVDLVFDALEAYEQAVLND